MSVLDVLKTRQSCKNIVVTVRRIFKKELTNYINPTCKLNFNDSFSDNKRKLLAIEYCPAMDFVELIIEVDNELKTVIVSHINFQNDFINNSDIQEISDIVTRNCQ